MKRKIGIVNSGGDVQGLNAVIASAVKAGARLDYEFIGFEKGWEGILDMQYKELDLKSVSGISHLGGTILRTVNKGRFAGKVGTGDVNKIPDEIIQEVKSNLEKLEIYALIVIGGDGTLTGALQLAEAGVNIVGVPKTIDNDLKSTDQTFGFSTAVDVVVEALDRVHTTAVSHDRVLLVETMGRHAGWIALYSGLAGGANVILLPEFSFSYNGLIGFLRERRQNGRSYSVIVVAEGAAAKGEELVIDASVTKSEVQLGGITTQIMKKIEELAPGEFELRNVVLGHIQRGGTPNAEDRILSKNYGVAAINAINEGKFTHMVALKGGDLVTVPLAEAVSGLKLVTKDDLAYKTCSEIGVFLGD